MGYVTMEKIKMTNQERELLDSLDQYLAKVGQIPPEIPVYREQAKLFDSICSKIEQGMSQGKVGHKSKTYRGVPIRCQY